MSEFVTRGGLEWKPMYIESINDEECIGCGRCFKVCGRDVLALAGITEADETVILDEDDDGDYERKVMTVANANLCIGCEACARVCPKNCQVHVPA